MMSFVYEYYVLEWRYFYNQVIMYDKKDKAKGRVRNNWYDTIRQVTDQYCNFYLIIWYLES